VPSPQQHQLCCASWPLLLFLPCPSPLPNVPRLTPIHTALFQLSHRNPG
jgi:hypothetical protein